MAMTKKGARKITVNDCVYLWKVSPEDEWYGIKGFTIQSLENQDFQILGGFGKEELSSITPNIIRQIILLAIQDDWLNSTGKDRKYSFKDYPKLKISTSALWKPDIFQHKQVLKKGETDTYYFNKKNGLAFSWGKFNILYDFEASYKTDQMIHEEYGEIYSIESLGEEFMIKGEKINKTMNFEQMEDEKWLLKVDLSEFIVLPKGV